MFQVELGEPTFLDHIVMTIERLPDGQHAVGAARSVRAEGWFLAQFRHEPANSSTCPEIWTWYEEGPASLASKLQAGRKLDDMTYAIFIYDQPNHKFMAIDGNHRLAFLAKHPLSHHTAWPVFVARVSPEHLAEWLDHPRTEGKRPGLIQKRQ
jgi:hypothetical protein